MACVLATACLFAGCSPQSRHKTLSIFFDGVPEPNARKAAPATPGVAPAASTAVLFSQHGPYAAKMCTGCHVAQTNQLVAPATELCFRCHDLNLNKKYIHGPIASGGCLVCHDPHASRYRYLLVSESDTFCFHCHDKQALAQTETHRQTQQQCTVCHDAHMSDKKFLLK